MDIVERLRYSAKCVVSGDGDPDKLQAADEIERLRAENDSYMVALAECRGHANPFDEVEGWDSDSMADPECVPDLVRRRFERLRNELDAAQAREAKLRAELCNAWMDNMSPLEAEKRLSRRHPTDDTALRERLKAERENIAHLFLEVDHAKAAAAIRALED